MACLRRGQGS